MTRPILILAILIGMEAPYVEGQTAHHQSSLEGHRTVPHSKASARPEGRAGGHRDTARGDKGRTVRMLVTSYDSCYLCTNKRPGQRGYGITASGKRATVGMCAASRSVPFGTTFFVPGYGKAVAEDRGGAIRGNHIDLYMNSHSAALKFGKRHLNVTIQRKG